MNPQISIATEFAASRPQPAALTCEVISSFAGLQDIRVDWDRLWHADPRAEVFQNFAWVRSFWSGYGDEQELCTIVVRDRDRIVGLLPLTQKAGVLRFLGSPRADYHDIVCEEAAAAAVLERVFEELLRLPGWRRCLLENVSEASRMARYLSSLPARLQRHVRRFVACPCPTITLNGGDVLKKSLRYHIRRQTKKLERLGRFSFRHLENEPGVEQHLEILFRQHMERQAFRHQPSQFDGTAAREYFRAMAFDRGLRPYLRFGVLELENQPIACHFGFQANGKYVWYKPTFSIDFYDVSPGELLLNEVIAGARANGLREVDLTIGDEPYKSQFATEVRYNHLICIEREPGSVRARIHLGLQRSKERMKQNPALLRLAREASERARRTWQRLRLRAERDGRMQAVVVTLREAWRAAVWSTDRLVLVRVPGREWPADRVAPGGIVLRRATLSELALASTPFADLVTEQDFQRVREHMKAGSELYLVYDQNRFAGYALLSDAAEVQVGRGRQPVAVGEGMLVGHRIWMAPAANRGQRLAASLPLFLAVARARGKDLCLCLAARDWAGARVANAKVILRVTQRTIFHRLL